MGNRRMISKKTIATNQFLSLPDKSKVLYFMLILNADDDGFVSDVKGIMNHFGARPYHMKALIDSNYIISFSSGVVLIVHWRVHNTIRKDRYQETDFVEEKRMVYMDEKNCYRLMDGQPLVGKPQPQVISKVKLSKVNEDVIRPLEGADSLPFSEDDDADDSEESYERKIQCLYGEIGQGVIFLTDEQIEALLEKMGWDGFNRYVRRLADYINYKGFYVKNHYETILKWYAYDTSV
ncbi:MAG: hypothetical protein IJA86_03565 [Clostridia bacterium]|nr:hypothetical protein [Clostridia bacterium]